MATLMTAIDRDQGGSPSQFAGWHKGSDWAANTMMPFKTILMHAANEQRFQGQLAIAVEFANRFKSHLIGLAVVPAAIPIPAGTPGAPELITLDKHRVSFRDEAQRMKIAFDRAAAGKPFGAEWILADAAHADSAAVMIGHARAADLVISVPIEAGLKKLKESNLIERLILGSGRPVLVVPRANSMPTTVGNRVLLAWNGTRESTRAAFDALPILKTARHVKVLAIGEGTRADGRESRPPEQLCRILARHDVRARPEVISLPGADVGPALISAIKAENADMLVMGCYGRSRLYEYVLGGASRHLLRETPVPLLLSH